MKWSDFDPTYKKSKVRGFFRSIDPTATPKREPVKRVTPKESADDVKALMEALNISKANLSRPVDTRDAQRAAIMGELAANEHETRVRSDQNAINRGTGAYRSGGQQATLNRIGRGYDQMAVQAEAGIQQDYANRQQAYDQMEKAYDLAALQAAMGNTNAANAFNQQEATYNWQINQANPWAARQAILGQGVNAVGNFAGLYVPY
jgi:glycine betaine/choline ABC-type transport system substrate-binding protein